MSAITAHRTAAPHRAGFVPLAAEAPLALLDAACLRLRSRYASCAACVAACPSGALRAGERSLALGAACTGCGRCQAACPTGALSAAGFDALRKAAQARYPAVTIDCRRVPATTPATAGLRVPCLGGIGLGALLELGAAGAGRTVLLNDRGWCAACPSGGATHPAAALVTRAGALLAEAGVPAPTWPQIVARPLPQALALAEAAGARAGSASRRGFLRAAAGHAAALAAGGAADLADRAGQGAPLPLPSIERRRVLAALERQAARHGGRVAQDLFHAVVIGGDCAGDRVCAAACPTGALRRYRDEPAGIAGVAHDPRECIGCGHCTAVCPRGAPRLARGAGSSRAGITPLTAFAQRECGDCGSRFAVRPHQTETRCERCRKSADLARSAFRQLFGARPRVA